MTMTEKNGPEFPKQTALKKLCKEIGKHLVRGIVDNRNALGLETVLHKEITNVDVPGLRNDYLFFLDECVSSVFSFS
jgi:hypothetical protein